MENKKTASVRMLVLCALFTALIAVGAFLRVPLPVWPFTLQTLFTTLAALLLGRKYGTLACTAYMVLGLVGLPIFTKGGGPQYIFEPTFGCILGFAVGAFVAGTIVQRAKTRGMKVYLAAALCDMVIVYVIGVAWFYMVRTFYMQSPIGLWALFVTCFVPTIGIDLCKAVFASVLAVRLAPALEMQKKNQPSA